MDNNTATVIEPTAGPGHNIPPADTDPLLARLKEDHADLIARRDELLEAIGHTPAEIADGDEETAGQLADFVEKQVNAFLADVKVVHQKEKAPFLQAGRTVDSFKHWLGQKVDKGKADVNRVRKKYADEKAARERRAREAEAARAREAEQQARREAEEKAAALKEEEDLDAALAAEEEAKRKAAEADRAAKAAAAKPAELGKTRGEYGGQTSLKQFWNFRNIDRATLNLEALRDHFSHGHFEQAIRSFINANKEALRQGDRLAGVDIFEDTRL